MSASPSLAAASRRKEDSNRFSAPWLLDLRHSICLTGASIGVRARFVPYICIAALKRGIQMLSVQPDTKPKGCAGCNRKIKDRYLLKALDKYWHEDCLKCACCDCRLGEVGSTLYTKANLILCRRDYLRLFGVTGNCAACSKLIPAFEMVMRAKDNVYHLDCFACQLCNQRFCVGDKFFLKNNMILCQTDYEEGLMKEGYAPQVR
uniref:LIM domain only protein 3 n=1 Tax=Erpetoichthys calabaricus TaxID=27687 RepID=A0A8C4S443_ERPCA